MASSKTTTSIALFFCLNLLFFSLVTACGTCSHPITRPKPGPGSGGRPGSGGSPGSGGNPGNGGGGNPGNGGGGNPGNGGGGGNPGNGGGGGNPGNGGGGGNPGNGGGGNNPGTGGGTCPRDALKIGICARVLTLVNATIGTPPVTPCCSLIQGLADLEAAICLCTAIRASILGININLPINLSLLLNVCSRNTPRGFQCP